MQALKKNLSATRQAEMAGEIIGEIVVTLAELAETAAQIALEMSEFDKKAAIQTPATHRQGFPQEAGENRDRERRRRPRRTT